MLVNGGLNLSTLDGWWAEAYDAECGWALGDRSVRSDDDVLEAAQLYSLLERNVVPEFYDRDAAGFPRRWIARMRASMARLAPHFSGARMVQEYIERLYVPAAASYRRRAMPQNGVASNLDKWSQQLKQHWSGIRFAEVTAHAESGRLTVTVPVDLGAIDRDAVRVELYADPENAGEVFVHQMTAVESMPDVQNGSVYRVTIATTRPPEHFTARGVPYHAEATIPIENPLIAWQR